MTDYYLRCITCQKIYDPERDRYTCDHCGELWGTLEVIYDYDSLLLKKNFSKTGDIFQFQALLPITPQCDLDHHIGGTPLFRFRDVFGLNELLVKYDGMSFSGSYKDRASIIAIDRAIQLGYDSIFCASTGNAASSLALLSAHTDLKTYIFVPATIPKGKLAQLQVAGAEVIAVDGTYDDVFDLSLRIGLAKGWYCRNSAINPYLIEGKKTAAFEIIVQNDYKAPDYCLVGVGDGTVISSLCKGFKEFYELKLVDKIPKIIGVQAENASTLKKVYERGEPLSPMREEVSTIADSIAVGNPRDVVKACIYLKEVDGKLISVSDEEILGAVKELAAYTGVFSEPAGAVTLAGLKKLMDQGEVQNTDSVCLVVTGNGLKDVEAISKRVKQKVFSIEEVKDHFKGDTL